MYNFSNSETNQVWQSMTDVAFKNALDAQINKQDAAKQVNASKIVWCDNGVYVCTRRDGSIRGRFNFDVRYFTPARKYDAVADIDTRMDGGRDNMGMLHNR